jgi:hypothetical protein
MTCPVTGSRKDPKRWWRHTTAIAASELAAIVTATAVSLVPRDVRWAAAEAQTCFAAAPIVVYDFRV